MEPQELIVSKDVPAGQTHEIYTDLDSGRRETRLISILPGNWNDEISCKLTVAALDS